MTEHERNLELVPLYALDALEEAEQEELEAHLLSCPTCSGELAASRSVAATLVSDAPASPEGWERISAELDRIEQAGEGRPASPEVVDLGNERARRRRVAPWLTAAAAVSAVVALGVALLAGGAGGDDPVAAADHAAELPGSVVADLTTDSGTVARVVLTADGEGFVVPTDLAALPAERTYQLWVITGDEAVISAGVLGHDPAPARFTWIGEVIGFALTRERAGGVVSSEGDVVSIVEI